MKSLYLVAAVAASLLCAAGAASASTNVYNLDVDTCGSGCGLAGSYGTVTVSGIGTDTLSFDVELNKLAGVFFQQAGNPAELFSLTSRGTIDPTSIVWGPVPASPASPATGSASGPGSYHVNGQLGSFAYEVKYDGPPTNNGDLNNHTGGFQSLAFTVTGSSPLALAAGTGGSDHGIYFAADVYGPNGKTGNVGAVFDHTVSVPEPATWAMMILGFLGMGATLRTRKHARPATVVA